LNTTSQEEKELLAERVRQAVTTLNKVCGEAADAQITVQLEVERLFSMESDVGHAIVTPRIYETREF
jgi:hypothetical protein